MGRSAASKTRRNHKKDGTRRRYIDAPLVRTVAQRSRPRYVVLSTKEDGTTKGKAIIRGNATLTVPVYATVRRKKVHIGHTRIAFVRQALTTDSIGRRALQASLLLLGTLLDPEERQPALHAPPLHPREVVCAWAREIRQGHVPPGGRGLQVPLLQNHGPFVGPLYRRGGSPA